MSRLDRLLDAVVARLGLDGRLVGRRLAGLDLDETDLAHMRGARGVLRDAYPAFAARFYEALRRDPETGPLLRSDALFARLKAQQAAYVDQLMRAQIDTAYVRSRLRVGVVHHEFGIRPHWFIAAWQHHIEWASESFAAISSSATERRRYESTFLRLALFDMSLALDAQMTARHIEWGEATERVRELEQLTTFHDLVEGAPDAILLVREDGRYVHANPAACDLLGRDATEVLEHRLGDFWADDTPVAADGVLADLVRDGRSEAAARVVRPDGAVRHVDLRARLSAVPHHYVEILRDTTEEHVARERIYAVAESVSSRTDEALFDAIVGALAETLGADGVCLSEIEHPDDVRATVCAAVVNGRPVPGFAYELEGTPCAEAIRSRAECFVETGATQRFPGAALLAGLGAEQFRAIPLRGSSGDVVGVLGIAHVEPQVRRSREDTDWIVRVLAARLGAELARRRADRHAAEARKRARHAERLESVGRLASGIAHNFNNVLTAVLGHAHAMSRHGDEDAMRTHMAALEGAVDHAAALTRELLAFARSQPLDLRTLDLREVVEAVAVLAAPLMGSRVTLRVLPQPAAVSVIGDRDQLLQVVTNLVTNAREAMPEGGRILLGLETRTEATAFAAGTSTLPAGCYAALWVADVGVGMDARTVSRIFEPFFTQRVGGGGTGLGLASAHGTVRQCGGEILVESTLGQGSTFTILLPLAGAAAAEAPDPPSATIDTPPRSRGGEIRRILVVDDDDTVRSFLVDVLEGEGFAVDAVGSAARAVTWLEGGAGPDAVVTDLNLADGSGRDVLRAAARLVPTCRLVLISGGERPDDDDMPRETLFLPKPFSPDALVEMLRGDVRPRDR